MKYDPHSHKILSQKVLLILLMSNNSYHTNSLLTSFHTSSIGLKNGQYGGKNTNFTDNISHSSSTIFTVCIRTLSSIGWFFFFHY